MNEIRAKVGDNGRLVIPATQRKALGINPGDEVVLRVEDDELRISTVKQALQRARRLVRQYVPKGKSLSESLMEDRREEAERE